MVFWASSGVQRMLCGGLGIPRMVWGSFGDAFRWFWGPEHSLGEFCGPRYALVWGSSDVLGTL